MRPLDKIEKYLKRFTKNIEESERSRYFYLSGCKVRVSDHFAISSVCYFSILLPTNDCKNYVITNHKTAKVSIVNYEELKGIVKSLTIIPDIIYNAEVQSNQSINSKIQSLETKNENYKKSIAGLNKTLCSEREKLKEVGKNWSSLSSQYESLQAKYKNVQEEYKKLCQTKKDKPGNSHVVFGINENRIPLSIRQQIRELIQPYK